MANAHLETIHTKVLHLDAMVSVIRVWAGNPENDDLPLETVGNYAWLMHDLLDQIQDELKAARTKTEVAHG
ncbi:hypothetical protein [Burkholderia cenocepacia]|uniref:hypothetical protein n=1 Tax=Burkholderia cenocepacia TaxID=95486 RepID=UPI00222FDD6F|nr:hypothetical protein [Burkholderia cenocepacia]MCW3539307.1 hypothetical protein [Burkholderia cenocepacia]